MMSCLTCRLPVNNLALLLRLVLLLAGGSHHLRLLQHAAAFSLDGWDHLIHHATATIATVHHQHQHAAAAALPFLTSASPKAFLQHLQGHSHLHQHPQQYLLTHHNPEQIAAVLKHQFDGILHAYRAALHDRPLVTKMITGGTLAVMGDAIAQRRQQSQSQSQSNDDSSPSAAPVSSYDARRAASFMAFDMAYRAVQHSLFPLLVANCHGQFLSQLLPHQLLDSSLISMDYLAAMERTLGSQLGIVPFLYYPVFFTFTGFLQGLTVQGSWARATDNFPNLMKRNLVFWIPVQFVQFGFVPDDLQIPFLSAAGLCWTFILSMAAGSAKAYTSPTPPGPPPLATSEVTAGGIEALASMPTTTIDEGVAAAALEAQSATTSEQPPKQAPVAA
jgi:Mpv17 / PMP22 family